jgi:hypothetical protein
MLIEKKWGAVFAHIDLYPDLHRVAFIALAQSCPQTDDVMWPERQAGRMHSCFIGRLVYRLSRFASVDVSLPCLANLGSLHGTTTTGYPDLILIKSICRISAPLRDQCHPSASASRQQPPAAATVEQAWHRLREDESQGGSEIRTTLNDGAWTRLLRRDWRRPFRPPMRWRRRNRAVRKRLCPMLRFHSLNHFGLHSFPTMGAVPT